ncbi:zinc finger and BTB [Desmophyllum pertusum]|uniref:Zinc finger and BTB n=1 Tax=Desmophyllum pertusum TaxID=174260 RepID=A0A9W9YUJ4_9CNID|nr:zinc finger and BTB [Desmophyllum pertusum]
MEVEDALETLRRYITVGNVEGAKEVILEYQTKLSSCHGQHIEDHQLCAMKTDEVGTALIPRETELENFIAVKTTGDGNCMFNAASLWLAGNELLKLGFIRRCTTSKETDNEEDPPAKSKKQPGKRDISSFFKPGNVGTSTMAAKKNTKVEIQGLKRKNESETATSTKKTSRKFLVHWIDDFPWIIYDDEKGVIFCEYCQHFGSTTGKSEFVKGCRTFKRETLKKHSDSFAHIKSRDAFMAKQMAEEDTPFSNVS